MHEFKGLGVALVTPFDAQQQVDYPALKALVDYVIDGGVDFIVALGTTAETPTLSSTEKKTILETIINQAQGRVKIVCGIGGNNTQAVIDTIKEYTQQYQFDGILSVTPYYNKPSQAGLIQHFSAIANSTTLPIIVYNVPGRTQCNILPDTVLHLAQNHSNIVAIKEASGSLPQCMELVQKLPQHFTILSGDDNLVLAQMSVGMHGVISVAANAYPKTFKDMMTAVEQSNLSEAQSLHYQILDCTNALFQEGNPTGIKCLLHHKGIIQNQLRLPLVPASENLTQLLQSFTHLA